MAHLHEVSYAEQSWRHHALCDADFSGEARTSALEAGKISLRAEINMATDPHHIAQLPQRTKLAEKRERLLFAHLRETQTQLEAVQQDPTLTYDSQRALVRNFSDEVAAAKEAIVFRTVRLISRLAYQYRVVPLPGSDKREAGKRGVRQAIEHFDENRGIAFPVFAVSYIREAIGDLVEARYGYGPGLRRYIATMRRVEAVFWKSEGRRPTLAELQQTLQANATGPELPTAQRLSLSMIDRLVEIRQSEAFQPIRLEKGQPRDIQALIQLSDRLEADDDTLFSTPYNYSLRQALLSMTFEERFIICSSRGLFNQPKTSLADIGRVLGIDGQLLVDLYERSMTKLGTNLRTQGIISPRTKRQISRQAASSVPIAPKRVRERAQPLRTFGEQRPRVRFTTEYTAKVRLAAQSAMTERVKAMMQASKRRSKKDK